VKPFLPQLFWPPSSAGHTAICPESSHRCLHLQTRLWLNSSYLPGVQVNEIVVAQHGVMILLPTHPHSSIIPIVLYLSGFSPPKMNFSRSKIIHHFSLPGYPSYHTQPVTNAPSSISSPSNPHVTRITSTFPLPKTKLTCPMIQQSTSFQPYPNSKPGHTTRPANLQLVNASHHNVRSRIFPSPHHTLHIASHRITSHRFAH
jgi:hypothetical protein